MNSSAHKRDLSVTDLYQSFILIYPVYMKEIMYAMLSHVFKGDEINIFFFINIQDNPYCENTKYTTNIHIH